MSKRRLSILGILAVVALVFLACQGEEEGRLPTVEPTVQSNYRTSLADISFHTECFQQAINFVLRTDIQEGERILEVQVACNYHRGCGSYFFIQKEEPWEVVLDRLDRSEKLYIEYNHDKRALILHREDRSIASSWVGVNYIVPPEELGGCVV